MHGKSQCPQCGSVPSMGSLDLSIDRDALRRPSQQGVAAQTADVAQIGGSEGSSALAQAEPGPSLETPVPLAPVANQRPAPRTFAERHRRTQLDAWRISRVPVLVILGYFTLSHLVLGSQWVFIDNVNLLLHEGGHKIWGWDGMTLAALGGTLGQLMFPAIFAAYFMWWQEQRFAAVACIWWFAENFIGIARYMDDAVPMELPLIGGSVHDWNYLFGKWGYLSKANEIADFFHWLGVLGMVGSLALLVYWTVRPSEREIDFAE